MFGFHPGFPRLAVIAFGLGLLAAQPVVAEPSPETGTPGFAFQASSPEALQLIGQPVQVGSLTISAVTQIDGYSTEFHWAGSSGAHLRGLEMTPRYIMIQNGSTTRFEPLGDTPETAVLNALRTIFSWISGMAARGDIRPLQDLAAGLFQEDAIRRECMKMAHWALVAWWAGAVLFGFLFPILVTRSATTIREAPIRSLVWGSLIALTSAILAWTLFESLVGILVLPIWLLILLGAVAPGGLAIAGASLAGILMSRPLRAYPLPGALGAGALLIIGMIFPWAGIALFALVIVLCFGGIAQSGFSGLSKIDNPEGGN